jgi:hypothetical protein
VERTVYEPFGNLVEVLRDVESMEGFKHHSELFRFRVSHTSREWYTKVVSYFHSVRYRSRGILNFHERMFSFVPAPKSDLADKISTEVTSPVAFSTNDAFTSPSEARCGNWAATRIGSGSRWANTVEGIGYRKHVAKATNTSFIPVYLLVRNC